jgi:hypothetical protein
MAVEMAPTDTAATLRQMIYKYRLTVTDCAEMLGTNRVTLSRVLHGHYVPSRLFALHVAQTAEMWKQNPPEPSPERRGGYRGDVCAQRALRNT